MLGLVRRKCGEAARDIWVGANSGVTRKTVGQFLMAAGDVSQFCEQSLLRRDGGEHAMQYSHQIKAGLRLSSRERLRGPGTIHV